jgi:hypothetical protein
LPLIQLRDVSKIYDLGEVKVEALKNVSLDIDNTSKTEFWLGHGRDNQIAGRLRSECRLMRAL